MSTTYTASVSYVCKLKLMPNMVEHEGYICPKCQLNTDIDGYCPKDGSKLNYGKYLLEDKEEQEYRGQELIDDLNISKLYSKNDDIYAYHIKDYEYQILVNIASIDIGEGQENIEIKKDSFEEIQKVIEAIRQLLETDERFLSLSEPKLYLVDHFNLDDY